MPHLKFAVKSVIHGAMELAGQSRRSRKAIRQKLVILTYHSFCRKRRGSLFSSLPIGIFERQVQFLRKHFSVVSLREGYKHLLHETKSEKPWLAITIDDGFQDNYLLAWPVLKKFGLPATIFIATDFVDNGRSPWPTQISEILNRTSASMMEEPFQADLRSFNARAQAARRLKFHLRSLSPDARFQMLRDIRLQLKVSEEPANPALDWQQIREMRLGGLQFGSHTVFHSLLPFISEEIATSEILDSKRRIEQVLQEPCVEFAYPDGANCQRDAEILQNHGFQLAVTQDWGANCRLVDPLLQRRIEVPAHDPLSTFKVRSSLAI